jgi:hypothetical protein
LEFNRDKLGSESLKVVSHRVESLPDFPDLQTLSRQWMGDRSYPFVLKLLTLPPLSLPLAQAETLAPGLRDFWATIADGDAMLEYPHFPIHVRRYIEKYSAVNDGNKSLIDNHSTLLIGK